MLSLKSHKISSPFIKLLMPKAGPNSYSLMSSSYIQFYWTLTTLICVPGTPIPDSKDELLPFLSCSIYNARTIIVEHSASFRCPPLVSSLSIKKSCSNYGFSHFYMTLDYFLGLG